MFKAVKACVALLSKAFQTKCPSTDTQEFNDIVDTTTEITLPEPYASDISGTS